MLWAAAAADTIIRIATAADAVRVLVEAHYSAVVDAATRGTAIVNFFHGAHAVTGTVRATFHATIV